MNMKQDLYDYQHNTPHGIKRDMERQKEFERLDRAIRQYNILLIVMTLVIVGASVGLAVLLLKSD